MACVVFELLTAEYLFDPHGQGELFTKDDDHMAQIIELMGDFPLEAKMGGRYSRELFDHTGQSFNRAVSYFLTPRFRCTAVHQNFEAMATLPRDGGKVLIVKCRGCGSVRFLGAYARG